MSTTILQKFNYLHKISFAVLHHLITALILIIIFWLIALFAKKLILKLARKNAQRSYVFKILADFCKITIIMLGIITALGTAGLNVSAIVASLGLSGFALSFALKDYLSSILAGFMIMLYQPYKLGDNIAVANSKGNVEEINLRYTVLLNEENRILIPNSTMLNSSISIFTKKP